MKQCYPFQAFLWIVMLYQTSFTQAQPPADGSVRPAGQPPAKPDSLRRKSADLFTRAEPLTFTLTARMNAIINDRTKPANDSLSTQHAGLLTYWDSTRSDNLSLPLTMLVRGNFRRNATNCAFPPLYLDFPKKLTKGTLFAKQNKLKLVTHCQGDEYVVREYLIYKLYNLVTDLSFRARLARVSYVDSLRKRQTETRWGFLIEDDDDVAKRNQMAEVKKGVEASQVDSLSMARLAVFEFMIGNIDWSVPYRHNIRLAIGKRDKLPAVMPYDFDHAALVDAPYAESADPSEKSDLPERVYRGPLYPGWLLKKVFAEFNTLKPGFYRTYETDKRLNRSYIKQTILFLDVFYTIINSPKAVRDNFFNGDTGGTLFRSFN